jgi:hypothetical protein
MLFLVGSIANADDVVVKLNLDNMTTQYISYVGGGTSFKPVRVIMSIENLSDRIQYPNLKLKYHFWLYKVSRPVPGIDLGYPVVAEGDLEATHGVYYSAGPMAPHSVLQIAYGVLPDAITLRRTYKGYLLPGVYVLRVEIPLGLPGSSSNTTTEATLFILSSSVSSLPSSAK